MIVSENIKLNLKPPFDDGQIDKALAEKEIIPLRRAIVKAEDSAVTLCVSYVKDCKSLS